MKLNFIFSLLFAFSLQSWSWGQFNHEWTATFGSSGTDYGNAVAVDESGNVYLTGRFEGTVDFDSGPGSVSLTSAGAEDIFVTKHDINGNLIWAKRVGGSSNDYGFSITIDTDANVVVAGSFRATVDFDPGSGTTSLTAAQQSDGFVLKLNGNGEFLWVKVFEGNTSQTVLSVNSDASSNILVSGYFNTTIDLDPGSGVTSQNASGGDDLFVVKLNSAGNYLWGGTAGSTGNDIAYAVISDANDNVYVTGQFSNSVDFDFSLNSYSLSSSGVEDVFVLKMTSAGVVQWVKGFGGTGLDIGRGLEIDSSGNVYTVGYFNATVDFNPSTFGTSNLTSAGSGDVFISRLDATGNYVWADRIGSTGNDLALSVAMDNFGDLFIAGRYYATVDFDPNAGIVNHTSGGDADAYVLRLNSAGQYVDVDVFGGPGVDTGFSQALYNSSDLFLTGSFEQTVNFDVSGGGSGTSSNGGLDCFVTRYRTCALPLPPVFLNGVNNSVCEGSAEIYSVLSVPGATSYSWTLPEGWLGSSSAESIVTTPGSSGGTISVVVNDLCGASVPTLFEVVVNPTPTISGNNAVICAGSEAQLEASSDLGTIEWFDQPTGGNLLGSGEAFTTDILFNSSTFYVQGNNNSCVNDPRFEINVTVDQIPTISGNDVSVCSGSEAQLEASSDFGEIEWYDQPVGGNLLELGEVFTTGILFDNTTVYVQGNNNSCTNDPRFEINITVDQIPTISGSDVSVCVGSVAQLEVSVDIGNVQWFSEPFGGSPLVNGTSFTTDAIVSDTTFYVEANNNTCINEPRFAIQVTTTPLPDNTVTFNGTTLLANQAGATYQWMGCDDGYYPLAGAHSQEFILTQNGSYAVEVSLNGCSDTSACQLIETISVTPIELIDLVIFPNPSKESFEIVCADGIEHIEIFSISGNLIYEKQLSGMIRATLSMDVAPGFYLIAVTDKSGNTLPHQRICIQ